MRRAVPGYNVSMDVSTLAAAVLSSSLVVLACGGSTKVVNAPEADPWAGYTGKYVGDAVAEPEAPKPSKRAVAGAKTKQEKVAPVAEEAPRSKKVSSATIHGESLSSVGLDEIANASKTASKSKVVSTKYLVGPKYEQLQITLKGAAIQIIRPAANPAPDGPMMSTPKARNLSVSPKESRYYDPDADVVLVVTAGKKAGAEKLLSAILKP